MTTENNQDLKLEVTATDLSVRPVKDAAYELYEGSVFAGGVAPTHAFYVPSKRVNVSIGDYHQNSRMRKRVSKGRAKAGKVYFKEKRTARRPHHLPITFTYTEKAPSKPVTAFFNDWVKNAGKSAIPKAD